jgi:hypothetical protein
MEGAQAVENLIQVIDSSSSIQQLQTLILQLAVRGRLETFRQEESEPPPMVPHPESANGLSLRILNADTAEKLPSNSSNGWHAVRGRLESGCFPTRASKQQLVLVPILVFQ